MGKIVLNRNADQHEWKISAAVSVSEHIRNEGKIEGQIQILDDLFLSGILNREQYESMVQPLRKQLQHILDGFEYAGSPPARTERPIRKTGKSKSKSKS